MNYIDYLPVKGIRDVLVAKGVNLEEPISEFAAHITNNILSQLEHMITLDRLALEIRPTDYIHYCYRCGNRLDRTEYFSQYYINKVKSNLRIMKKRRLRAKHGHK